MRLRIYKRKVLALLLALAAAAGCALVLWGGAGETIGGGSSKREDVPPPPPGDQPLPPALASGSPSRGRLLANSSWPPQQQQQQQQQQQEEEEEEAAGRTNRTLHYRSLVYRLNFDQPVLNEERFGGRAGNGEEEEAVVVVVQVHDRAEHLRLLLASLRRAAGVEQVLLVLSHDVWSAELNALAASVDFCRVQQIFFPFSLQLYPGEFPGTDPRDCPRDAGQAAALRLGCLNARYPDAFGHYREAAFAQTKHHWWWKLHFVWERLRRRQEPPGLVLFLEEDHYVAPDFLHVLRQLRALQRRHCPDCQVLSLGTYAAVPGAGGGLGFGPRAAHVELKTWKSTEHNMGLALARDTYRQLLACTDAFCTYDDYNWDWTLQHLTVTCLPRFWKVLVPEIPRVFHTGADCGMHHRRRQPGGQQGQEDAACRPAAHGAKVDALLSSNRQHLFPAAMSISKRYALAPLSPHVKNGGWGDIRDHELCKSYRRLQ